MSEPVNFVMTKPAPIIWAHVVKPRSGRTVGATVYKPMFEATFLFEPDHPDLATIKGIMGKIAKEQFGHVNVKFPLTSGTKLADEAQAKPEDKRRDREFLRGKVLFKPHANVTKKDSTELLTPPRLVALNGGKYLRYREDDERPLASRFFYNGVLAVGTVSFVAYTGMGGGVAAYLNEILSLNSGEKINTGVDDEARYGGADRWSQYVGTVSSVDPTAGLDDEIPF